MIYSSTWRNIKTILNKYEKQYSIKYSSFVFLFFLIISHLEPKLLPIVITSILVYTLRLLIYGGTRFDREDYNVQFPIISNLGVNYFSILLLAFVLVPILSVLSGDVYLWAEFGKVSFVVAGTSIFVIAWSMAIYEKNFFYNYWHLDMRILIVLFGILSLLTPIYIPSFILIYHVINQQYNTLSIGTLGYFHSGPPLTMLLIISGFVFTNLLLQIQSYMVIFLLLCGYSSHYFFSGFKKLGIGGANYYILNNNPFFMAMNAYQNGWLNPIPERIVAMMGWYTEKWKTILNLFPLLIEIGSLFVLVSYSFTLLIGILHLILHLSILLITGDNFWKWMTLNISMIIGMLFFADHNMVIYSNKKWLIYSLIFIILSNGWMFPKALYWLDTPYLEYFKLEAEFADNSEIEEINLSIFSPWDELVSQGFTGTFTYLGNQPRITYSWGNTDSVATHRAIMDIYPKKPNEDDLRNLAETFGEDTFSKETTKELKRFLKSFIRNKECNGGARKLGYFSTPKQYYHHSSLFNRNSNVPDNDPKRFKLYRIDGIWTRENFHTLRKIEVLSVNFGE